jgi:hypothetical protein
LHFFVFIVLTVLKIEKRAGVPLYFGKKNLQNGLENALELDKINSKKLLSIPINVTL